MVSVVYVHCTVLWIGLVASHTRRRHDTQDPGVRYAHKPCQGEAYIVCIRMQIVAHDVVVQNIVRNNWCQFNDWVVTLAAGVA
jgi:hypothetical protein